MRGGYDAASLLAPIGSDYYYQVRPNIAIAKPARCRWMPTGACTLPCAIHLPAVHAGQVAFVPFAGTEDLSRSHFETQDSIELGQPLDRRATTAPASSTAWPPR
jgi:uncharacterized protein (DUF1501 family)